MQSSKGKIKLLREVHVEIIIRGKNNNNKMDKYFKSGCLMEKIFCEKYE